MTSYSLPFCTALAVIATSASAELKYQNDTGGSVELYGQLNPAYLSFDDGQETTDALTDSTHSNSRIGLWVRQAFGENTFTFNFETGLGLRPSSSVSQTFEADALNWQRVNIRKIDFSLKTERYGVFSAGQGSMAADGAAEVDLSGTTLATYVSIPDTAGAFSFRETGGNLSNWQIGDVFGDFDGGRLGRIRYDTPVFSGFSISASYGTEILAENVDLDSASIAINYAGEIGDFKMAGALAYARTDPEGAEDFSDTIGSFSVLHSSGTSVTVASGRRSEQGHYAYGKLGYQGHWLSFGKTALSIDYYRGWDRSIQGSRSDAFGFGAVQHIDDINAEIYLGYRTYELTDAAADYQDASSIFFGTRWKF